MKVLFITDIHNNYERIMKLPLNASDIIVIGGDFTIRGGKEEVKVIIDILTKNFKNKILAVPGNMDRPEILELLIKYDINIECKGVRIDDVGFFGCGGSEITPFNTPNEKESESIYNCLINGYNLVKDAPVKIMVSHNPPYGVKCDQLLNGNHVGSKKVKEFIELYTPDYCLTGHIHEGIGKDKIGKTIVVNPGPFQNGKYAILDTGTKEIILANV